MYVEQAMFLLQRDFFKSLDRCRGEINRNGEPAVVNEKNSMWKTSFLVERYFVEFLREPNGLSSLKERTAGFPVLSRLKELEEKSIEKIERSENSIYEQLGRGGFIYSAYRWVIPRYVPGFMSAVNQWNRAMPEAYTVTKEEYELLWPEKEDVKLELQEIEIHWGQTKKKIEVHRMTEEEKTDAPSALQRVLDERAKKGTIEIEFTYC